MAYTSAMTTVADVDDSIVTAFDAGFIVAAQQADVMSPWVQYRADIGAKAIEFPRYAALAADTTALDEDDDVTSEAMVDTKVTLTPKEYGKVVTKTALASLQTGGKADLAAARLVGEHLSRVMNMTAIRALEASGNVVIPGAGTEAGLLAGDVMSATLLNKVYNKLARASIPFVRDGLFVAFMHDDVITDLRAGASAGDWTDVIKYADPATVLRNEVGVYKGFIIVRNNDCVFADQTGAGTVDAYKSSFMGFNGLGRAVSLAPGLRITSSDKLNRFVNVGWYGVWEDKIVEPNAVWTALTASSVGAN